MILENNLLVEALEMIGHVSVRWFRYAGQVTGDDGINTTSYDHPIDIMDGIVLPVNKQNYEQFGFDLEKLYVRWYLPSGCLVTDLDRNVSGDIIEFNGGRWQLIGSTDWSLNGWKMLNAVRIGSATGTTTNA